MMTCIHCDEPVLTALFSEEDEQKRLPFCCYGCLTVYQVLHDKGLETYYEIKKSSALHKRRAPVDIKQTQFQFLDDTNFLAEYALVGMSGEKTMEFYLEGIHCLACLWLIEKLPDILDTVATSKLNLDRSVVTVVLRPRGKFSAVARELNNLGYRPHPIKKNQDIESFKIQEERSFLMRIGVAGAAAGNIMIYAVSLYGGASGEYAQLFNSLTVVFAIPVLTYCALPFYRNAWNAIKNRTLSIDIPISTALLMGAMMGIFNLLRGIPENYFDSLTALVFLLLLSRYFLQKIQEKGLSAQDLHYFYSSESVLKVSESGTEEIHPKFIKMNDVLKIRPGEIIPADGIVLDGTSHLNNSLLTGESFPVKVHVGDPVFSGTQNIDQYLLMRANLIKDETRLGKILKNVENGWAHKSHIVNVAGHVSKYFTLVVFALSFILFIYLYQISDTKHALEQALTLLIVTCPCALALAIPLTFTRSLSKASEQGIIIKNDEVIEKLSQIKNIFIDKTGTLTYGKLQINEIVLFQDSLIPVEDIIFNLEINTRHPVGLALLEHVKKKIPRKWAVTDRQELLGIGVSGKIEGRFYEIKKDKILEDGILIATFEVEDTIRLDSKDTITNLIKKNLNVKILSGDKNEVVQKIAILAGLPSINALSDLSPEKKSLLIRSTPHSMMVGDGANDAIALSEADVGVAVLGAMDISLRAADVYLTTPGLIPVEKLITLSRETMKIIHRNIALSLIYNSLSVTAAFMGLINPLVAAIIMPLSSLTVLLSTFVGTKTLRNLWK